MNRRGFIGAFIAAASAPKVAVKEAAKAIGVSTALVPDDAITGNVIEQSDHALAPSARSGWRVANHIRDMEYARRLPSEQMPAHIRTKKSWSEVYKSAVYVREEAILKEYVRRIETDENLARRVAGLLGIAESQ